MIERFPIPPGSAGRAEWLDLRRKDITASDVPTVCGAGLYGSPAELYAEKKGLRPPRVDTGVLKRGRWKEASVFDALADERPEWDIRRAKIYLRDPELRLGATPDGFALAPDRDGIGIIQAKTTNPFMYRQRWLRLGDIDDEDAAPPIAIPPVAYQLQTLTEMMLAEVTWGVIALAIDSENDMTLRLFDIERHADVEWIIKNSVAKFWADYLDANVMPPFELQRDEELIKQLYPEDDGSEIDLSTDNRALALAEDYELHQKAAKDQRAALKLIRTELTAKLGAHTFGRLADGRRISWKQQHRKSYVVDEADFRVLRILKAKAEEAA